MSCTMDDFFEACAYGDVDRLKDLLVDDDGMKQAAASQQHALGPLHLAASLGHTEVCRFLVEELGFDVNACSLASGVTPLSCAASHGEDATAGYLLGAGAATCTRNRRHDDTSETNGIPMYALMYSRLQQHLEDMKTEQEDYLEEAVENNKRLEVEIEDLRRQLRQEREKNNKLEDEVKRQQH